MNKMLKGAIAGATGITLLVGGFGTYALWNDEADIAGTTVTSGLLDITAVGTRVWKDLSADVTDTTWDAATDVIVPGDTVEMRQPITIAAEGKNLKADLSVNLTSMSWTFDANTLQQPVVTFAGVPLQPLSATTFGFRFDTEAEIANLNGTNDLVVTFTMPSTVAGTSGQAEEVSMPDSVLTLTQVR